MLCLCARRVIRHLNLDDANLKVVDLSAFTSLEVRAQLLFLLAAYHLRTILQKLRLRGNCLTSIASLGLEHMPALRVLDLRENMVCLMAGGVHDAVINLRACCCSCSYICRRRNCVTARSRFVFA